MKDRSTDKPLDIIQVMTDSQKDRLTDRQIDDLIGLTTLGNFINFHWMARQV